MTDASPTRFPITWLTALALAATALPAAGADLAPGRPPLTQELADLRRDAVEVVFDVQLTARQLREHQRLYAWYWTFATADWQKAEAAALPEFRGVFDKPADARRALRDKYHRSWKADAEGKAAKGSPYHRWVLDTARAAAEVIAAGPPALRRDHLDNTLEFVQWGLRMHLTVRQQEEFLRMIPREWDRHIPQATRESVVSEFLPVYRKVVRLAPTDRGAVHKVAEPALAEALKSPETPLDHWLRDAHAAANEVLAQGPPDVLTAGTTAQHADFYDWALDLRLPDAARRELGKQIADDWKAEPSHRRAYLDTAKLMDDPPRGGAGELSRLRDKAEVLRHVCGQKDNAVNRAAMDAYRAKYPRAGRPAPPDDGTVLAAGDPPLTVGVAERSRAAFEWMLGFEFDAGQRAAFRKIKLAEWERKDKEAMQGTVDDAFWIGEIFRLTPEDSALVRAFVLPRWVRNAQTAEKKDPGDQWVLEQYYARHPLLTPGKPGPTTADADALGELLRFQTREVTGGDAAAAEKVASAAVAKVKAGVGAAHEVTGAAQQLALVRYAWPTLSEADRQELRDRWATSLRPLGVSPKLAAWQATPAPSREIDTLEAWRKLQLQQQNTAMISNMLRMQHETNMTIIRNMGSTPYRYEYRYEYRRR